MAQLIVFKSWKMKAIKSEKSQTLKSSYSKLKRVQLGKQLLFICFINLRERKSKCLNDRKSKDKPIPVLPSRPIKCTDSLSDLDSRYLFWSTEYWQHNEGNCRKLCSSIKWNGSVTHNVEFTNSTSTPNKTKISLSFGSFFSSLHAGLGFKVHVF